LAAKQIADNKMFTQKYKPIIAVLLTAAFIIALGAAVFAVTDYGTRSGITTDMYNGGVVTGNQNSPAAGGNNETTSGTTGRTTDGTTGGVTGGTTGGVAGDNRAYMGNGETYNNHNNPNNYANGVESGEVLGAQDTDRSMTAAGIIISVLIAVAVIVLVVALIPKSTNRT